MTYDPPPDRENPPAEQGLSPTTSHTLWDIATPEEVARSILRIYPKPLPELSRRERYARRSKEPENMRFWAEVRKLIAVSSFS